MPCLLRGWKALNIPGQYSFSCPEQAGKGKELPIYKAIENTLGEWFCTFHGCKQIKEFCLNLFFCMRSQGRYLYFWPQWKSNFFLTTEASQVYLPSPLCEERKAAGSKQSQRPDSVETEQGELARQINKEFAGVCKTKAAAKEVSVGKKKTDKWHTVTY